MGRDDRHPSDVSRAGSRAVSMHAEIDVDMGDTPLLTFSNVVENADEPQYAVYPRRYWLLFLLSIASMQQSAVWMTWSPAVTQVQELYGWPTWSVDLLAAWGPILYVPLAVFTADVVDRLGLRASITVAASLTLTGTIIRSVTTKAPWAEVLAHLGQILNAFAGPLVCATPSKLSVEWFAPHQRTTATSISIMANYVGTGVGFLVALPITSPGRIKYMLWAEAGLSAIIVAMCVLDHVFFPPLPPLPPSASASAKREVHIFRDSLKLIRNPNFLVIAIAYGISLGTYSGWSGVLDPILAPLHYSQDTVNWLGFASTVGCVIGGVGFGNLGDRVRRVKLVIILLFVASFLLIGWFSLIANHVVGRSTWQLFLSCTLGSLTLNAGAGLFYEAAADLVYPLDEIISSSLLTMVFNTASAIYTMLGSRVNGAAMNWTLTGCSAGCGLAMLFYNEKRVRQHVDDKYGSADTQLQRGHSKRNVEAPLDELGQSSFPVK